MAKDKRQGKISDLDIDKKHGNGKLVYAVIGKYMGTGPRSVILHEATQFVGTTGAPLFSYGADKIWHFPLATKAKKKATGKRK